MLRFRLFQVPFEIGPYFWVGSAFFGYGYARGENAVLLLVVWVACVFLSIVSHELGHALAARHFGAMPTVELHAIGGLTRMFGRPLTRYEGLMVSLAGPAAGFVLYLTTRTVRLLLAEVPGVNASLDAPTSANLAIGSAFDFMIYINLVWTAFNLLPILPLDGGQVMRNLLGPRLLGVTRMIGTVCAAALAVLAALHGQIYLTIFLGFLAFSNLRGDTRAVPGGTSQ